MKYDKQTLNMIKKLIGKRKKKELSKVDEYWLDRLIKKEIDFKQIKEEIKKCKNDVKYFINNYIYVKNKIEGDNIPKNLKKKIQGDKIKFELQPVQEELLDAILNHNKIISVKSRQIGFTTTTIAAALQLATFNNNKNILIFSKSEKDAIKTLDELKFMQENLPFFLRRKSLENNKKTLKLGDKYTATSIESYSSGKNSGRSASATQLILDEAEFIQNIDELQSSAAMTLSATGGKAIILSTPQMHGSQFYKMVKNAELGKNGFALIKGDQRKVPGRDEKQYEQQCSALNQDKNKIKTELDMEQIIPYNRYFHEKILEKLKDKTAIDYYNSIEIYDEPKKDGIYLIGVDTQEGGNDNNAIVVLNIKTRDIVALLYTKKDIVLDLIYLSDKYNNAYIALERNRAFALLKDLDEREYIDRVLYEIKYNKDKDDFIVNKEKKGIYTSTSVREKYLQFLSEQIRKHTTLPSILKNEFQEFVIKKNGKPEGLEHDDAIMALGVALTYIETIFKSKDDETKKVFKNIINNLAKNVKQDKSIKSIENKINSVANIFFQTNNFDLSILETLQLKNEIEKGKMKKDDNDSKSSKYIKFLYFN